MKAIMTICAVITSVCAYAQNLEWSHTFGGDQSDYVNDMCIDLDKHIILTGVYQDTVDFDPSANTFNIISQGGDDFFVQKLNGNGELLWAKSFGGQNDDSGHAVAVDSQNNIYVAGMANDHILIIKLASDGSEIWTKFLFGTGLNRARNISVDPVTNDILVSSDFQNDITLDINGVSTTFSETTADAGAKNILVTRLNSDGDVLWAESIGEGIFTTALGDCLFDHDGNMYVIGGFRGTCDFDPGPDTTELTSMGQVPGWIYHDIFIQKLNPNGNFVWVKHLAGNQQDYVYDAEIAGDGLYLIGSFLLGLDFDPGVGTMNIIADNQDGFILKLDLNGDFKWVEVVGGPHADAGLGISADSLGSIYACGYFRSTTDFGTTSVTSINNSDAYVLKMDTLGNYQNSWHMGGEGIDGLVAIATGNEGEIFVAGSFEDSTDFDLSGAGGEHASNGMFDVCVLKLNESLNVNELVENSNAYIYPNPSSGSISVASQYDIRSLGILDMQGNLILEVESNTASISHLASGTYMVCIENEKGITYQRFTKE